MMSADPRKNISKLRDLALSLNITGNTDEQALLLAIIDTLEEIFDADAESMRSKCPNCGAMIHLNISDLQNGEPMTCPDCNEAIGVITGSITSG